MDLLSWIGLPYWLMIVGAIFIAAGFLDFAFTRDKKSASSESPASRPQMPPLPRLLDTSSRKDI
jgi:hypothetical protein